MPELGDIGDADDIHAPLASQLSDWDIAVRYHDFKRDKYIKKDPKLRDALRSHSVHTIISRAKSIIQTLARKDPESLRPALNWNEVLQFESVDLDATLEESPLISVASIPLEVSDYWIRAPEKKPRPILIVTDTSLSMNGEKLALTAVALAVVFLQFPDDPIGMIAFENEARILKQPDERITLEVLIERFLDVPAQGYTHLERGLKSALQMTFRMDALRLSKPARTLLLTDGKYTAGRDPSYLAKHFRFLDILRLGQERSAKPFCEDLARAGHGMAFHIPDIELLPFTMYETVKRIMMSV